VALLKCYAWTTFSKTLGTFSCMIFFTENRKVRNCGLLNPSPTSTLLSLKM
jgi:hypothetical protein